MAAPSSGKSGEAGFCQACGSWNQAEFASELIIHFSGRRYIDHPGVPQSSKIVVCTDCGVARLHVPEDARAQLAQVIRTNGPATARAQRACHSGNLSSLDVCQ